MRMASKTFLRRLSGSTFPNLRIKLTTVYSCLFCKLEPSMCSSQGCPLSTFMLCSSDTSCFSGRCRPNDFWGTSRTPGSPKRSTCAASLTRVVRIASVANNLVCCMDENRKVQVLKHHGIALATRQYNSPTSVARMRHPLGLRLCCR